MAICGASAYMKNFGHPGPWVNWKEDIWHYVPVLSCYCFFAVDGNSVIPGKKMRLSVNI